MPESGRSFYIGTNNELAGYEAGKRLIEANGGSATGLVIVTGIDDANQSDRLKGFQTAFGESEDSEILTVYEAGSDKITLNNFLDKTLPEHPELNAIFCAESSSTGTVGLYLEERERYRDIHVIGFDEATPIPRLVAEGVLSGTMIQQAHDMGYNAVKTLLDYIQNPGMESTSIYTETIFVGTDEAEDYLSW